MRRSPPLLKTRSSTLSPYEQCAGPRWVSFPLPSEFRPTVGATYTVAIDR